MDNEIKLDIGCGRFKKAGFIGVDKFEEVDPDVLCDLEIEKLPYSDDSVCEIRASQVFEHIRDLPSVMNECHRVLRKGGLLTIDVPYWSSEGAFRDPTHVRFFSEKSFDYYEPGCECAYYSEVAPFRIVSVAYVLHPSKLVSVASRILGLRVLKAFNNVIIGLTFELTPLKENTNE